MFVVIFLEQWMKETNHTASILGLLISVICLIFFGADAFLIPTMILIVVFTFMWARIAAVIANKATPKALNRMTGVILVVLGIVIMLFNVLT